MDYKQIIIKTKKLIYSNFLGQNISFIKNEGLDFSGIEEYSLENDARLIDWKISAKYQKPYIKKFESQSGINLVFVVLFDKFLEYEDKKKTLFEALSLLFFASIKNEDKVSFIVFDKEKEFFLPSSNNEFSLSEFESFFANYKAKSKRIDFKKVFDSFYFKLPSVVVVFGDLVEENLYLKLLNPKNEYIFISINDKKEFELSGFEGYSINNIENKKVLDYLEKNIILNYNKKINQIKQDLKNNLSKFQIRFISLTNESDIFKSLVVGLNQ